MNILNVDIRSFFNFELSMAYEVEDRLETVRKMAKGLTILLHFMERQLEDSLE